jgi:hypothetical protein
MRRAALALPPLPPPEANSPEICFLTGARFWHQTAFCAASFQQACGRPVRFVVHDDGTFTAGLISEIRRLLTGVTIVSSVEIEQRLDHFLPATRFPALRDQRRSYIHLRKLTDFHVGRHGWRAVLDSDMLFFRHPAKLLEWFAQPAQAIHMLDVDDAYGYPHSTLWDLAGGQLPERVNVGICGLRSDAIDWQQIEDWCAELLRRHGTSYYLEQALVALWLGQHSRIALPADDYRLLPNLAECRTPTAVLHHYVDLSKRGYFRHAWRHFSPPAKN